MEIVISSVTRSDCTVPREPGKGWRDRKEAESTGSEDCLSRGFTFSDGVVHWLPTGLSRGFIISEGARP